MCSSRSPPMSYSWLTRLLQQQLSLWGEACDEDVSDVTDKLGVLLYEIGELEDQYVDRYDQYRITMKSIRNIEASVQPSRDSMFLPTTSHSITKLTQDRETKNHGPNRPAKIQRTQLPAHRRPRAGTRPRRSRIARRRGAAL